MKTNLLARLCLIVSTGALLLTCLTHIKVMSQLGTLEGLVSVPEGCFKAQVAVAPGVLMERTVCPPKDDQPKYQLRVPKGTSV